MARHSHFRTIKEKKEKKDIKRAKLFSKIRREIALAIKYGKDPSLNPRLKTALEKAKRANMPKETIERVLKREKEKGLEEIILEIIGPGKTAIILKAMTDNKNRTRAQIKELIEEFGGKLARPNTLRWQFKKVVKFSLDKKEALTAIELGAEDLLFQRNETKAVFPLEKLAEIKKEFEKRKIKIRKIEVEWVPLSKIKLTKEIKEKNFLLFEKLFQIEEVKGLYFNF